MIAKQGRAGVKRPPAGSFVKFPTERYAKPPVRFQEDGQLSELEQARDEIRRLNRANRKLKEKDTNGQAQTYAALGQMLEDEGSSDIDTDTAEKILKNKAPAPRPLKLPRQAPAIQI